MLKQLMILSLTLAPLALAQMADHPGAKDPALFTRMPKYYLPTADSVVEKEFGRFEFPVKAGTKVVEGKHTRYAYEWDEGAGTPPGFLQIVRNYEAAARRIGGEVLASDVRQTTLRLVRGGAEVWVAVEAFNEGRKYEVNVIEKGAMRQDVVADAAALKAGLAESGHVEVPGIHFDFAKAEVKAESEPALKELTALLQQNAGLRVWVVGHTDNVGTAEANVALSGARAAAVVQALVKRGIAAARLAPHGAGPYAPVATNRTEEGRAKNRRVELVAQL